MTDVFIPFYVGWYLKHIYLTQYWHNMLMFALISHKCSSYAKAVHIKVCKVGVIGFWSLGTIHPLPVKGHTETGGNPRSYWTRHTVSHGNQLKGPRWDQIYPEFLLFMLVIVHPGADSVSQLLRSVFRPITSHMISPGVAGLDCDELWRNANGSVECLKPVVLWLLTSGVQSAHRRVLWSPLTASMHIKHWVPEGGHLWAPMYNQTQEGEVADWV